MLDGEWICSQKWERLPQTGRRDAGLFCDEEHVVEILWP